jgi:Mn-dependent DtxR family transcriptional regulator
MFLTQEFLAQMLGVQRASVSGFAGQLQDMDLIRYRRGRLSIVDGAGLAARACECHGRLQGLRASLLGGDEEGLRAAG